MQEMSYLDGQICQDSVHHKSQKLDTGYLEQNRNFLTCKTEKSRIRARLGGANDGVGVQPVPVSSLCSPLAPFSGTVPPDVLTWLLTAPGAGSLGTLATEVPTSFIPAAPTRTLSLTLLGSLGSRACSHTSHWDGLIGPSLGFTSALKAKVHRD